MTATADIWQDDGYGNKINTNTGVTYPAYGYICFHHFIEQGH